VSRRPQVLGDERGAIGGAEVLPFGFLIFVVGTLLLVNVWGVVDGKLAASAAAREAARAYVESPGPAEQAMVDADRAARAAFDGHRVSTDTMSVEAVAGTAFVRCAPATFEVTYRVPTIRLPWIGGLGGSAIEVQARHSEIVDPYRSGEIGMGDGGVGTTPC
jgi:Flp pilus assembly protein TadG